MKRHFRILLTVLAVTTVTLGFAFAISSMHSPLVVAETEHGRHGATAHPQTFGKHDPAPAAPDHHIRNQARVDMQSHAHRRLGHVIVRHESLGGTTHFSHQFELHWLDVEHDGNVVRLYHATDRQHPQHRFVWMWHSGAPHPTAWEEVR